MLRAFGSASSDITHETRGAFCYGHWVLHLVILHTRQGGTICCGFWILHLVISHTRQAVRFIRGIWFCVFRYHTRDRRYDLLRALRSAADLRLVIPHTRQRVRYVTDIGFCVL